MTILEKRGAGTQPTHEIHIRVISSYQKNYLNDFSGSSSAMEYVKQISAVEKWSETMTIDCQLIYYAFMHQSK